MYACANAREHTHKTFDTFFVVLRHACELVRPWPLSFDLWVWWLTILYLLQALEVMDARNRTGSSPTRRWFDAFMLNQIELVVASKFCVHMADALKIVYRSGMVPILNLVNTCHLMQWGMVYMSQVFPSVTFFNMRCGVTNTVVCPARTHIGLALRPVWSGLSLSARRTFGFLTAHWVHSEDPDRTVRTRGPVCVVAEHTCRCTKMSCPAQLYDWSCMILIRRQMCCDCVLSTFRLLYVVSNLTRRTLF